MRKCLTLSGIICFCVTSRAAVAQHSYTVELVTSDLSVKAAGVNSAGQVVGTFVSGGSRAFLWHDGVLTNLGTLPGGTSSGATAINENGVITGTSTDNAGSLHAFRYSAGVMTDLGTLGGTNSGSYGTNGSGEVVGYSNMAGSSAERAFRHDGSTMTGLGTLSGGVNSAAYGINDAGEIVGS